MSQPLYRLAGSALSLSLSRRQQSSECRVVQSFHHGENEDRGTINSNPRPSSYQSCPSSEYCLCALPPSILITVPNVTKQIFKVTWLKTLENRHQPDQEHNLSSSHRHTHPIAQYPATSKARATFGTHVIGFHYSVETGWFH